MTNVPQRHRQTDGQTDNLTVLCIASRGKSSNATKYKTCSIRSGQTINHYVHSALRQAYGVNNKSRAIAGRTGGPRDAAVKFDTYRILQRHRAVSLPQHGFLVGLCLQ